MYISKSQPHAQQSISDSVNRRRQRAQVATKNNENVRKLEQRKPVNGKDETASSTNMGCHLNRVADMGRGQQFQETAAITSTDLMDSAVCQDVDTPI